MAVAALKGVLVASLSLATSGTGIAVSIPVASQNTNIYVKGAGTISAGTLIIEEADDPTYTGTWSSIQSVDLTTLTAGAILVVHVAGIIRAIRARLSVAVSGGGTVSTDIMCG